MKRITRRDLIKSVGGMALAMPLVGTDFWNPAEVFAQQGALSAAGYPKRFVYFFHPNGTIHDEWWPTGTETDFEFGRILEPLTPFKDKIIIPRGLNFHSAAKDVSPGERHQSGMGTVLTGRPLQEGSFVGGDGSLAGWGDGISVDQEIANYIGDSTPFKSLHMGIRADTTAPTGEVRTRISYTGPASPIPPKNDPLDVYQDLFLSFMPMDGEDPMADPTLLQRKSVLDAAGDQFAFVNKRAGYKDRIRLEAHQAMIRDLERRLANPHVTGEACYIPEEPEQLDPDHEDSMPEITRLHIDMLVAAFACDLTRVGSLQFSNAKNHIRFPWIGSTGDGHQLSHASSTDAAAEEWIKRDNWFAQQFAYLLNRLDSITEGDGTLLDNTCIVWINELSVGNLHSHIDMPFLMAGSAGGHFNTGRYMQYNDLPHNDMLVSLQNAYGIESQTFGDARFVNGALTGIS